MSDKPPAKGIDRSLRVTRKESQRKNHLWASLCSFVDNFHCFKDPHLPNNFHASGEP